MNEAKKFPTPPLRVSVRVCEILVFELILSPKLKTMSEFNICRPFIEPHRLPNLRNANLDGVSSGQCQPVQDVDRQRSSVMANYPPAQHVSEAEGAVSARARMISLPRARSEIMLPLLKYVSKSWNGNSQRLVDGKYR